MTRRRPLLLAALSAPVWLSPAAQAQQRKSLADPLRLGVDGALVESGLARALVRAFGRDTGIAVQLVPGPALPLLDALERGELDAALTNAPDTELKLAQQGLAHDRRAVAMAALVLVGPAPKGKPADPAGVAGSRNIAEALQRVAAALAALTAPPASGAPAAPAATTVATATSAAKSPTPTAAPTSPPAPMQFLSAADGSGAHVAEQALWRAAKVAPVSPWYAAADKGATLASQARTRGAYALVERGSWAVHGGAPLAVLVEGDPSLELPVHVMRSFRINHPAAKIFIGWITGPKGARVVAAQRGYRAPKRST